MLVIGCDHAGYPLKQAILAHLYEQGIAYQDVGCDGASCDYPDIAEALCAEITSGRCTQGILVCGTGVGMSMVANKIRGIRAAVCTDSFSTKYTRMHNDANVLCLGARVLGNGLALELVDIFLQTKFEGGRHQRRIDMMTAIEEKQQGG